MAASKSTFSWFGRARTNPCSLLPSTVARDYEILPTHSEGMIHLSMTDLMARSLTGEAAAS